MELKRIDGENEYQYIWRLCSAKENSLLEMNWHELAEILNKELREDESEYYDESAYRKSFQYANSYYRDVFLPMLKNDEYIKQINNAKDELFKIKKQTQDQRREYNKNLVDDARADHMTEKLLEAVKDINKLNPLTFNSKKGTSEKEAIECWADWHYGMVTKNIWNEFNTEICRERVSKLVEKTIEYIDLNNIKVLHLILLGDACHGAIHNSCRVASEENVSEQLIQVSEIMAQAIEKISGHVSEIKVYSTYGNHLRTIQNKDDSIHSDNMEKIIPWWIKARFSDNENIQIIDSEFEEFIKINICGYNIVCCHGDLDNFRNLGSTVNNIFTKLYNETIDYTISADKHHLEEFEQFNIESILVRSLCGTDEYANNKRLYSNPGQTLMIFNKEDGRECTYNIKFN